MEIEIPEFDLERREEIATDECKDVIAALIRGSSEEYFQSVGRILFNELKLTPDEVAEICLDMEGLPDQEIVARLADLTDTTP